MIRILLQSDDGYFVNAFSNYASLHCANIEFVSFTTAEKALAYLSSATLRLDAVLATREVLDRMPGNSAMRLLVSDRTLYTDADPMQINIYQAGPAILSDIKNALALSGNRMFGLAAGRQVRVVSVYSVQGGSGKSVLSYALAAAAAREGKQALYLSLDPFPAWSQLYEHSFTAVIDDLLFAIKGNRDPAPVLLDAMERNADKVLVLPPFRFAGDLLSLSRENLEKLLGVLVEKTDLDYIFLDLPVGFQELNFWALEQSTCVLQVYSDDDAGRERLRRMQQDVYFKNLPIRASVLTVLNKCRRRDAEEGITAKIPRSESLLQGRRVTDVQERNPAFLKSCTELLQAIN